MRSSAPLGFNKDKVHSMEPNAATRLLVPFMVLAAFLLPVAGYFVFFSDSALSSAQQISMSSASRTLRRLDLRGPAKNGTGMNYVLLSSKSNDDPRHAASGWMLDPVEFADKAGLLGGATSCVALHVGEVLPGKVRGNHRHQFCNETLILWGAKQRYRVEDPGAPKGYTEISLGPKDVAVVAGPVSRGHSIFNLDTVSSYLLACQDAKFDPKDPRTDYHVWPDS